MKASRRIVRYGSHRSQVAELWCPVSSSEPTAVVVLLHGGFWRNVYTKRLMHRLASDVAGRGWAAWNVEYRRVGVGGGGGGWPWTLCDVADAIDHLKGVDGLDVGRVALCGHSAGGQLALWAASRTTLEPGPPLAAASTRPPLEVRTVVSLAGVVDLVAAANLGLGSGAVQAFLGGEPNERPERYEAASPAAIRPSVDQLLVHGTADNVVPLAMSERYAEERQASGAAVKLAALPGVNHVNLIDPGGPGWRVALDHLTPILGGAPE
jgi:acetyl esterase/lipase